MRETYVNFHSFINKLFEVVALAQVVDCFPLEGFNNVTNIGVLICDLFM